MTQVAYEGRGCYNNPANKGYPCGFAARKEAEQCNGCYKQNEEKKPE